VVIIATDIKYFMFSQDQVKKARELYAKLGKQYKAVKVLVNGVWKEYSEIVSDPKDCHFSDAIIVVKTDINKATYTKKE
jgi:hypothetical protein